MTRPCLVMTDANFAIGAVRERRRLREFDWNTPAVEHPRRFAEATLRAARDEYNNFGARLGHSCERRVLRGRGNKPRANPASQPAHD